MAVFAKRIVEVLAGRAPYRQEYICGTLLLRVGPAVAGRDPLAGAARLAGSLLQVPPDPSWGTCYRTEASLEANAREGRPAEGPLWRSRPSAYRARQHVKPPTLCRQAATER